MTIKSTNEKMGQGVGFERIRRITGYLVGTLDRFNDAKAVAQLIEEKFPQTKGKIAINNIGTTIGSHTGPGTVALFFWGEGRE